MINHEPSAIPHSVSSVPFRIRNNGECLRVRSLWFKQMAVFDKTDATR